MQVPEDNTRETAADGYTPPGYSPNYKWHVVGMLWFIAFFNYADRQAFSAVQKLIAEDLHLTKTELGVLGAAFGWVYGLGAPVAGYIGDRIRRKTAILAGLQAWSVVCMATAGAWNFGSLLIFRAAIGLGETFYFPAAMSFISDYHGNRTRSRAMGFHQTSVYVGTIAGSFFAAWIASRYGWKWSFIAFGGLGFLLSLVLWKFLVEPKRGATDISRGEAKKLSIGEFLAIVWTTPTVLTLMGGFLFANAAASVILAWMPMFVSEQFGMDVASAALVATLPLQLASMIGSPLGGYLADRFRMKTPGGRMMVQFAGLVGCSPFVLWCGQTNSLTVLMVALAGWGLFKGIYDANIFAAVYDVVRPEVRGTTAGFMNTVAWLAGYGSMPIVFGAIADRYGFSFAISTAAVVYPLGALCLLGGILFFVRRDHDRMEQALADSAQK